jgi:hypothetical protein
VVEIWESLVRICECVHASLSLSLSLSASVCVCVTNETDADVIRSSLCRRACARWPGAATTTPVPVRLATLRSWSPQRHIGVQGERERKKKKRKRKKIIINVRRRFFIRTRDKERKRAREQESKIDDTRLCAGAFRSASLLRRSPPAPTAPAPLLLVNWLLGLPGTAPPLSFLPLADTETTSVPPPPPAPPLDDEDDEDAATTPSSSLPSLELIDSH